MSDLRFVSVMMFCGSCKSISRSNGRLMHLFVSDELPWSSFEKEKGERKNVIELHFISLFIDWYVSYTQVFVYT